MTEHRPRITGFRFGSMEIDAKIYNSDVIIQGDTVFAGWSRKKGHRLGLDDLSVIPLDNVRHIIVGTGYYGIMRMRSKFEKYCTSHGIILEALPTADAVERFNACSSEKNLVGAFHVRC